MRIHWVEHEIVGRDFVDMTVVPSPARTETYDLTVDESVAPVVGRANIPGVHVSGSIRVVPRDDQDLHSFSTRIRDDGFLVGGELDEISRAVDRCGHFTTDTC